MNVVEEPKVCPINIMSSCPLLHQPGKHLMSYLRHIKRARKSNVFEEIWYMVPCWHFENRSISASSRNPLECWTPGAIV